MKYTIFFIIFFAISAQTTFANDDLLLSHDTSTWKKYHNQKYNYYIAYPKKLELWLTGNKSKQDGKAFSIVYPKITRTHGLFVELHPNKTMLQIVKEMNINIKKLPKDTYEQIINKEQVIKVSTIKAKSHPMTTVEVIHTPTKQTFMRTDVFDGVSFTFDYSLGNFTQELANKIISSFRFQK